MLALPEFVAGNIRAGFYAYVDFEKLSRRIVSMPNYGVIQPLIRTEPKIIKETK